VGKVFMFIFSIILGIGQGYQPVVGFNYGAKRFDRVREAFSFTLKLNLAVMTACAAAAFAYARASCGCS
jgi:Na+-driven multidrug efflux pump